MAELDEQSAVARKKPRLESLPDDFLEPLPLDTRIGVHEQEPVASVNMCRQFWKAGDYEVRSTMPKPAGMEHVRVHPKFLHSNATSHKWCLGAIAELLDNAVDEIANGATYINIDVLRNPKGGAPMLLFEDDGRGMSPDRLRQCMSFGYSEKTKKANTIGQYGNGFKTSTMRLGSDVIVFSRSPARNGQKATRSVGLLSYTFLQATAQQEIIVPMIDFFEEDGRVISRGTPTDFATNLGLILKWGPYETEKVLKDQFKKIKSHGTRILVYNLWENEEKQLELDFQTDPADIQVKGTRDENRIAMAELYPSAKHYFTYHHSLRSYASILYLRLPGDFKMILRGKEIEHHSIKSDLIHEAEIVYKPQAKDMAGPQMRAIVTLGFVKDAKKHIDVQGFNVYHKNRLIKPFWRIWNTPSSQGRGVVGILEANFVEPAHNKQGFERTPVLQRLETRLQHMQKTYWNKFSHCVGYNGGAAKKRSKLLVEEDWEPRTTPRKGKVDLSYEELLAGQPSKQKATADFCFSDEEEKNALALVPGSGGLTRARTPVATVTDDEDDIPILDRLARKTASDGEGKETRSKKWAPAARISDDGGSSRNRKTVATTVTAPAVEEEEAGRKSKRLAAKERAVLARRNKKRRRRDLTSSSDYSDDADNEEQDETAPAKAKAFLRTLKNAGRKAPEKQTAVEKKKGPGRTVEKEAEREVEKEVDEREVEKEAEKEAEREAEKEAEEEPSGGEEEVRKENAVREAEVQTDETSNSLEKLQVENLQLKNRLTSLENELGQEKAKQKGLEAKQKDLEETYASKLAMLESELENEKAKNKQLEVEVGKAEDALVKLHQDLLQGDSLYQIAVDNEDEARKRALEDEEELRRQLKNARNRVLELEAENRSLKGQ